MKKFIKILGITLLSILGIVLVFVAAYNIWFAVLNSKAKKQLKETPVLTENGFRFRDLNKNGKLDIYEDSRQNIEARVNNLISQMNIEEKAGMMWHAPIGVGKKGEVLGKISIASLNINSTWDFIALKHFNTFNLFMIPESKMLATWHNSIQKIAEQTRLGIPVTISTDPRHGISNFIGTTLLNSDFSKWPEPLGMAAIGDSAFMVDFGRIANQEYRAVGIRTALHPMADLATEPRWARINGTFGEDALLSSKMIAAYIHGFQGDSLDTESVACMVKHWPGAGPQGDGEDAHFRYGKDQAYPGNNFNHHLIPFKAAFNAGAAMVMPYYGIPKGQTSEDVGMSFNKEIITKLLREEYKYDGVVCTDWGIIEGFGVFGFEFMEAKSWGVDNLSIKDRVKKVVDAGVDQFGGNTNVEELIELIKEGQIPDERINQSVKRLLRDKFKLGLFDNPYVDVEKVKSTVAKPEFVEKGKLAQRRSVVLLKNQMYADSTFVLPLKKGVKIYTENINREIAGKYATVVDSVSDADFAVLHLQTPWEPRTGDMVERMFHQGKLDFDPAELNRILKIMERKPTIICIYLDRPAVIPEIAQKSTGLLADFGLHDDALLDVVFGEFNPSGKLPFEMPSSMEAVKNQKEDVPFDSENPLFPFSFGLSYH